jgi:hypothetical protein
MTSPGGETTPRRRKGGDDVIWIDVNLTGLKEIDGEDLKQR